MKASTLPIATTGGDDYVQTLDLGGSRFGMWSAGAVNPVGMVGATTVTPLATLSVPPTYSTMGAGSVYGAGLSPAGVAQASPWSPKSSPLPWVILFLILGVYGIHKLYFEKR